MTEAEAQTAARLVIDPACQLILAVIDLGGHICGPTSTYDNPDYHWRPHIMQYIIREHMPMASTVGIAEFAAIAWPDQVEDIVALAAAYDEIAALCTEFSTVNWDTDYPAFEDWWDAERTPQQIDAAARVDAALMALVLAERACQPLRTGGRAVV